MSHSYSAELNGSPLVWPDVPREGLAHQRIGVLPDGGSSGKTGQLAEWPGRLAWLGGLVIKAMKLLGFGGLSLMEFMGFMGLVADLRRRKAVKTLNALIIASVAPRQAIVSSNNARLLKLAARDAG